MRENSMRKLKMKLPMSSAMYCHLINHYVKRTAICCHCRVENGECATIAQAGNCKAFDKSLNDVLVFRDSDTEFATTRMALAHALEVNQDNEDNPWIGETVDAVIEDYKSDKELAASIYELISSTDIIAEITI